MEIKNKYGYVRVGSKTQESNSSIESQKQQLIESSYQVILDDKLYHVDKLLTNNISQGFIVFEKLLI